MATTRDQADPYFNPSAEENRTPEFGRESRGYDVNKAFDYSDTNKGQVLAGLGDFLGLKVKVEDNFFKNRIDEEITSAVDLNRDAEILSAGGTSPQVNQEQVPDLLVQQLRKADSLTAAKRAGSVRDTYYWNRMDVIARETRQRYPGHREYIDQRMSSMLGTTPANALVRELQSRQTAGASKTDQDQQHWERVILEKTTLGPAYMAAKAQGKPWSLDTMKSEGTRWMSEKLAIDTEKDDLLVQESRGKKVEREAENVGRNTVNTAVKDALKPFIGPDSEFGKLTATLQEQASRGELVDPADETKARALIVQMRGQVLNGIEAEGNRVLTRPDNTKTTLKAMMGQERWNNVTGLAKSQLAAIEDAYNNKDYNLLQHNLSYVTSITNTAKGRLLTQNEHALLYNTLKETLGPQAADRYLTQNSKQFGAFVQSTSGEALLKMFEGLQPARDIQRKFQEVTGEKNPQALTGHVDKVVELFKDPKTPDKAVGQLANTFFGPANHGYVQDMDAASQHNMYLKLTDPAIAKRLYDGRSQNPKAWSDYQNWSTDTFIALNNKDLNDAKTIVTSRKNIQLGWDPTTSQLRLAPIVPTYDPSLNAEQRWMAADIEKNLQKGATDVVTRLNKSLEGIKTQIKIDGRDPNKELPIILKQRMQLDLGAANTGNAPENFFSWINNSIDKALNKNLNDGTMAPGEDPRVTFQSGDRPFLPPRVFPRPPGIARAGLVDANGNPIPDLRPEDYGGISFRPGVEQTFAPATPEMEAEALRDEQDMFAGPPWGPGAGRFSRTVRQPLATGSPSTEEILVDGTRGIRERASEAANELERMLETMNIDDREKQIIRDYEKRKPILAPRQIREGIRKLGGPEATDLGTNSAAGAEFNRFYYNGKESGGSSIAGDTSPLFMTPDHPDYPTGEYAPKNQRSLTTEEFADFWRKFSDKHGVSPWSMKADLDVYFKEIKKYIEKEGIESDKDLMN